MVGSFLLTAILGFPGQVDGMDRDVFRDQSVALRTACRIIGSNYASSSLHLEKTSLLEAIMVKPGFALTLGVAALLAYCMQLSLARGKRCN